MAMALGPEGNNGMPVRVGPSAPGAATRIGNLQMAVEPLHDAAFEGDGFGFGTGTPAIKLGKNACQSSGDHSSASVASNATISGL